MVSDFGLVPGHPVADIRVDEARARFPVSATAVRENPLAHVSLVPPAVLAHLTPRFCFLGGESTGKSTLTIAAADRFGGTAVAEFGRTLWEERRGRLTFPDFLTIARTQVMQEEAALRGGTRWVFCDTSPLTTLFYSNALFDRHDLELAWLSERRYDAVFLCAPDFHFVQDGTRVSEEFRQDQDNWYRRELTSRGIPFHELRGDLDARLARLGEVLGSVVDRGRKARIVGG